MIIPNVNTTQSTNEAGDQVRTEKSMSPAQNAKTVSDVPVYLPKGTAFFMGITGTGLVTFVGLHRSQEYHWYVITMYLSLMLSLKTVNISKVYLSFKIPV